LESIGSEELTTQYLFFALAGDYYCIDASKVREIVDLAEITKIPTSHPCVMGVTNIRGDLIPIVDLRGRFGFEQLEDLRRASFIIVNVTNSEKQKTIPIAMFVDRVVEVVDIDQKDILNSPEFGNKIAKEFVENIIRYQEEYIVSLKIDRVLDVQELSKVQKVG
jgi:purine-binding chemotaxis protein CheW